MGGAFSRMRRSIRRSMRWWASMILEAEVVRAAKRGLDEHSSVKPDDATGTCSMWGRLLKVDTERWASGEDWPMIAQSVCVPGSADGGGSVVRRRWVRCWRGGSDRVWCGSPVCPNPTSTGLARHGGDQAGRPRSKRPAARVCGILHRRGRRRRPRRHTGRADAPTDAH